MESTHLQHCPAPHKTFLAESYRIRVERGVPAQVWSSSRMRVEITRFISKSPRVASKGDDTFKNQSKSNCE
ncbi:hypothetical protein TNCV_1836801 [Trichonephila clavipes]|nr:hypothetical protein TNCV_1836801 [Trichonephila clavipes]